MNPGRVICERRDWRPREQFRLRCQYDARTVPPGQGGTRETERLSERAARQLSDAVEWNHANRTPFTTFLTLTFNHEARQRIAGGETTIQAELGRFFDAANKARARGFYADPVERGDHGSLCSPWPRRPRRERVRFDPAEGNLRYLWVAECPTNEHGEPNPHVHLLIRWRCAKPRFLAWAMHIEKLWGQGFAHLERLRHPREAGDYLLKALGYLSKAREAPDQGVITGNRYFIAHGARPPAWEHEWTRELGLMPRMMRHAARWQRATAAPVRRDRARLIAERKATPHAAEDHRRKLSRRITALREKLRRRPIIAGKYVIRTDGRGALRAFLAWAEGREGSGQGTWILPRRRPKKPYRGGPRPPGLGVALAAEVCEHIEARRLAPRFTIDHDDLRRWAEMPEAVPTGPPPAVRVEYLPAERRLYRMEHGEVTAMTQLRRAPPCPA